MLKVIRRCYSQMVPVWIDLYCSRVQFFLLNLAFSKVEKVIFSALFLSTYQLWSICRAESVPHRFWCTFSDKAMNSWWCGNNASNEWINVVHLIPRFVWLRAFTVMGFWFLLIAMSIWDHNQNWFLQMSWYCRSHYENAWKYALASQVFTLLTCLVGC